MGHCQHSASHAQEARSLYGAARISPQRVTIAECVLDMCGAFTAEELHAAVSQRMRCAGLATVYRALVAMHSAGTIAEIGQRAGSTLFARCGRPDHHHHLVCDACGNVVGVECPIDHGALSWPGGQGTVVRHEITLYGLCPACSRDREMSDVSPAHS